jgi:hypothetical protein
MEIRAAMRAGLLRNLRRYERKVISVIGRSSANGQGATLHVGEDCG